jgi:hypothetical protein
LFNGKLHEIVKIEVVTDRRFRQIHSRPWFCSTLRVSCIGSGI